MALAAGAASQAAGGAQEQQAGRGQRVAKPAHPERPLDRLEVEQGDGGQHRHRGQGGGPDGPPEHVPVADVGQLVGDDQGDLVGPAARPVLRPGTGRGQQGVVDDHPAGPAQPRDVGVDPGRAAAGVGHEHVAHRHPHGRGQLQQPGPQRARAERAEPVEQRLDQHRPGHRQGEDQQDRRDRRHQRPAGRVPAGPQDQGGERQDGQDQGDRPALGPVAQEPAEPLGGQPGPGVLAEGPDRERQPDPGPDDQHGQGGQHHPARRPAPGQPGNPPDQRPAGAAEGEGGQHGQVGAVPGQPPALAGLGVVDAGPHLVLGERLQRVGRRRPGHGDQDRRTGRGPRRPSGARRSSWRCRGRP